MALIGREVLTAVNMTLPLFTGGQTTCGLSLTGTWAGTVSFQGSYDATNFVPITVTPFASGTGVQSATGNGNWFIPVGNLLVVRMNFTTFTSGSAVAVLAAAIDSSWQDAFLASSSKYVTQEQTGGTANTMTQAAQANRAWRLRSLSVAMSVAPANPVKVTISDGPSTNLWVGFVPKDTPAGGTFLMQLPPPDSAIANSGGVVNTPGNSMVITLAAPGGSVTSELNAEFLAN